ncbi:efflux RND transporter periplasmic adaptor subunit [Glacieibacterium megasporae]|uniref:efflux RND transporter periplasmic adaptor subunit n=1 Tax=Glacieibacterium megasporae TaxID=2835787 RepID=UPI001C1DE58F|nr:biotin/lipoyl-binding protein [Polymorphobacter megasporae]UAJ08965.1 biotin/lipoyl-binding protein [Polymorphobacter megasporae]
MRPSLAVIARFAATIAIVALAIFVGIWLWQRYESDPWTRDGHIRADVVRVTPDVAGLVTQVAVHDNQIVKPGDLLFVVDRPRFAIALAQVDAAIASAHATLNQAKRETKRDLALGDLVAAETHEQNVARVATASAALLQQQSARVAAQLNLDRTSIRATVHGTVTNLDLHPGDYIGVGQQAMALVDTDSLRVEGYFEETKLRHIHNGDAVVVRLMGDPTELHGRVDSIAAGVNDGQRTSTSNQLPDVNPTFNWVRLAQRIPVRVKLIDVPAGVALIAGRTATVTIVQGPPR